MSQTAPPPPPPQGPRLVDVEVNNENSALNLLVSFLGLAQRRGAFGLDEAAKIFECVKVFQKPAMPPVMPTTNTVLSSVDECCVPCEDGECCTTNCSTEYCQPCEEQCSGESFETEDCTEASD